MLDGTLSDIGPAKTLIVSVLVSLLKRSSLDYSHLIACHLNVGNEASTEHRKLHNGYKFRYTDLLMLDMGCFLISPEGLSQPCARGRCELPLAMAMVRSW